MISTIIQPHPEGENGTASPSTSPGNYTIGGDEDTFSTDPSALEISQFRLDVEDDPGEASRSSGSSPLSASYEATHQVASEAHQLPPPSWTTPACNNPDGYVFQPQDYQSFPQMELTAVVEPSLQPSKMEQSGYLYYPDFNYPEQHCLPGKMSSHRAAAVQRRDNRFSPLGSVPSMTSSHRPAHSAPPTASLTDSSPLFECQFLQGTAPEARQSLKVTLANREMWRQFESIGTEMIVTNVGRRMFPYLAFKVEGLHPERRYNFFVDMILYEPNTLKFQAGHWVPNGQNEVYPPPDREVPKLYVHPDSPNAGKFWMKRDVNFHKLKITNDRKIKNWSSNKSIFVYSMHKFIPRIYITESLSTEDETTSRHYACFYFPGTEFIAVTAYQNSDVTELKIHHNPFAKGFRDRGNPYDEAIMRQPQQQEDQIRSFKSSPNDNESTKSPDSPAYFLPPTSSHLAYYGMESAVSKRSPSTFPDFPSNKDTSPSTIPGHVSIPQQYPSYGFPPSSTYDPANNLQLEGQSYPLPFVPNGQFTPLLPAIDASAPPNPYLPSHGSVSEFPQRLSAYTSHPMSASPHAHMSWGVSSLQSVTYAQSQYHSYHGGLTYNWPL